MTDPEPTGSAGPSGSKVPGGTGSAETAAAGARTAGPGTAPAGPLLIVAATELELEPLRMHLRGAESAAGAWGDASAARLGAVDVVVAALGIGKANTAAGLALALARHRPRAVVQVGVGGGYLGSYLAVGAVAVARSDVHLDLGVRTASGWSGLAELGFALTPPRDGRPERFNELPTHPGLTGLLARAADAAVLPFATLETVTGDVDAGARLAAEHDVAVESMEGAAAAQVCDRLGVPFAEVRGISNVVGERDRARWNLRAAAVGACDAVRAVCRRWDELEEARALGAETR